ncbi:hypothetical protein [Bradyrhizobium australafricanum]|uniref:hypothetical protein n=1 Tax=Bradyrhizobium australafricanum TaxID=2821406 RepID=UPI001CE349FD|nr:hypothetical protein [Bradyrhizobium australafricanum]MCA6105303.1 hypothetical protein [Bradyrhizobium australafricanum]
MHQSIKGPAIVWIDAKPHIAKPIALVIDKLHEPIRFAVVIAHLESESWRIGEKLRHQSLVEFAL